MEFFARLGIVGLGIALITAAFIGWDFPFPLRAAITATFGSKFARLWVGVIGAILVMIGVVAFLGGWTILGPPA